jgi:TetR/AcrR family transcriptional repressor of nem operon
MFGISNASPYKREARHSLAAAGLGSEAARASADVRTILIDSIRRGIDRLSAASPGTTPAQRRRTAIAAYSAMVGAVVLARIVDAEELSDEILTATRSSIELD